MMFPVPCGPYGFECDIVVAELLGLTSLYLLLVAAIGFVIVLGLDWLARAFKGIWWDLS